MWPVEGVVLEGVALGCGLWVGVSWEGVACGCGLGKGVPTSVGAPLIFFVLLHTLPALNNNLCLQTFSPSQLFSLQRSSLAVIFHRLCLRGWGTGSSCGEVSGRGSLCFTCLQHGAGG